MSQLLDNIEKSLRDASTEALLRDDLGGAKAYHLAFDIVRSAIESQPSADDWSVVSLDDAQKEYVTRVLNRVAWNRSMAAKALGIERSTLNRRVKRWGLAEPDSNPLVQG